jgi:long-chain acyl-CoA synthetase
MTSSSAASAAQQQRSIDLQYARAYPPTGENMPAVVAHLYEILGERAARFPTAIALGAEESLRWRTVDSGQLVSLVDGVAQQLLDRGVSDGDRVVLWSPSGIRTPVFLFALWKLGAVVVPFDKDMNPQAAAAILSAVEPRLVVFGYDQRPAWAPEDAIQWWEPVPAAAPTQAWQRPREELAAIFFTSGTTGQPKGCMITHANLCSQLDVYDDRIPIDSSCRFASILPLSHLFELSCGLLYPMLVGAAVHYIPSRRPNDVVRVLQEQRITHMMAVPQLLALMGKALEQRLRSRLPAALYRQLFNTADRLPVAARRRLFFMVHRQIGGHLRLLAAGGAPLAVETQQLWQRLGVDVVQGYGTSECSPVIACGLPRITPPGSVGPPLKGVQVRLSSEGELQVRGPNVMRGYWHDPERTAQVLSPDGWYATGDLASQDEHGNIWLRGRARDLIVLPNGLNVWPEDVEDALRTDPAVRDAAVIPVNTPGGGVRLHAYLIPTHPSARQTDPRALLAHVNSGLASHQRVSSASWWPDADFPRSTTLKLRRHLLPQPGQVVEQAAPPPVEGDPIAQAVASAARVTSVADDQTLAQLGLDSLGLVELAAQLEEVTGRALSESSLSTEMTLAALRAAIAQAPVAGEGGTDGLEGAAALPVPPWFYRYGWPLKPLLTAPFDLMYGVGIPRTIVLGADQLRNLPSTVVFAGNHRSFADMPLVRVGLSRTPARRFARRLVTAAMGEGEGWRSPLARYVAAGYGLYPLDRVAHREASLRRLAELASGGNAVLIFPQGAHVRPADERGDPPAARFKTGVAHVAEALDAPVIPFGLAGTEAAMPPFLDDFHGLVVGGVPVSLRRTVLAIAFGPPQRQAAGESAQDFTERLERLSYALAAEADRARADPDELARSAPRRA